MHEHCIYLTPGSLSPHSKFSHLSITDLIFNYYHNMYVHMQWLLLCPLSRFLTVSYIYLSEYIKARVVVFLSLSPLMEVQISYIKQEVHRA